MRINSSRLQQHFEAMSLIGKIGDTGTNRPAHSPDVKGKHVIIYDDMIRTGGSLINAAKAYKSFGANRISVITTHGIFVGNVIEKLIETGIIDKVICTDTHPNSLHVDDNKGFVVVKSVAKMMLNFILPNQ